MNDLKAVTAELEKDIRINRDTLERGLLGLANIEKDLKKWDFKTLLQLLEELNGKYHTYKEWLAEDEKKILEKVETIRSYRAMLEQTIGCEIKMDLSLNQHNQRVTTFTNIDEIAKKAANYSSEELHIIEAMIADVEELNKELLDLAKEASIRIGKISKVEINLSTKISSYARYLNDNKRVIDGMMKHEKALFKLLNKEVKVIEHNAKLIVSRPEAEEAAIIKSEATKAAKTIHDVHDEVQKVISKIEEGEFLPEIDVKLAEADNLISNVQRTIQDLIQTIETINDFEDNMYLAVARECITAEHLLKQSFKRLKQIAEDSEERLKELDNLSRNITNFSQKLEKRIIENTNTELHAVNTLMEVICESLAARTAEDVKKYDHQLLFPLSDERKKEIQKERHAASYLNSRAQNMAGHMKAQTHWMVSQFQKLYAF